MSKRPTRQGSETSVRLQIGLGRLDRKAHDAVRDDAALVENANGRMDEGVHSRRPGKRRVSSFTDPGLTNGAWSFATISDYALVPAAAQLVIPAGGFAIKHSFIADRDGANEAYIISARVSAGTAGPFELSLSTSGVATWTWYKQSDGSAVTISSTAHADGAEVHGLLVFDAVAGTTRLYVDGVEDGTAVTGIASTERPKTNSVQWMFGARSDAGSPIANTGFTGRNDATTLFAFRGADITATDPNGDSLLGVLRGFAWSEWNNPMSSMVLACFDWNESSGAELLDRSDFQNHGTLVGTPTSGSALALPARNGNHVGIFQGPNGKRVNSVMVGGDYYYETVRGGTT